MARVRGSKARDSVQDLRIPAASAMRTDAALHTDGVAERMSTLRQAETVTFRDVVPWAPLRQIAIQDLVPTTRLQSTALLESVLKFVYWQSPIFDEPHRHVHGCFVPVSRRPS